MFSIAYAQAASSSQPSSLLVNLLPIALIVVMFYFLLIRPQQKRTKMHREMLASLQVGNEIVTSGGILGKIAEIHESFITIDVGDGRKVTLQKQSVQTLLPKGTIENI